MPGAEPEEDGSRSSPAEDDPTRIAPVEEASSDGSTVLSMARAAQARPRVLGPYTLVRLLGRGGMGAVWEAVDFRLDRNVALKVSTADPSPDAIERFRREATNSARLRHPHIVSVHDVGFDQGQQYLVMDLVRGITLAEALRSGRLTYRRKAEILEQVARAVHYAHEQGVVHRDLKPSNIMLESRPGSGAAGGTSSIAASAARAAADDLGEPLVMDFGLAKDISDDTSLSRSGFAIGTPSYMPPEQAEGRLDEISPRSDVWSLGAILYEMLTGRPPFTGEGVMRILKAVISEEPVPPRRISRDVPRDLETICLACLRKDPERRYASAEALADDLRAWLAGESISARPATPLERSLKLVKRHRLAALALVLVLPTLVALGLLYAEHLKELAAWRTVAAEDFSDDGWKSRWRVIDGGFERRDGRLVSQSWHGNIAVFTTKLAGPVAIEYDAEMLPGSPPCDISLIWAKDLKDTGDGSPTAQLTSPIEFKIGAFDGSYSAIMMKERHLAYDPFRPVAGRRYHVRVEVVDNRATLAVDGRTLCAYTDPFPLTGGYACLYGFYPGKAFGPVRILALSVPQKVPATAIGDVLAQNNDWRQAAEQYARVASSNPGTAIAEEAIYKQGLCEFRRDDRDAAFATWGPLAGGGYDELVALHRLDVVADAGDADRLLADIEALYRRATPPTRIRVAVQWADYAHRPAFTKPDRLARLLDLHDRVFPDQTVVDNTAADCLLSLRRCQELLDRYPRQRSLCAMALRLLDREHEIAVDYPDQRAQCSVARYHCALYDRLQELGPVGFGPDTLIDTGHAEQALANAAGNREFTVLALMALGRLEEVAALQPRGHDTEQAAILLGRYAEVTSAGMRPFVSLAQRRFVEAKTEAAPISSDDWVAAWADHCRGIQALAAGDAASARQLLVPLGGPVAFQALPFSVDQLVLIPLALDLGGESGSFARACDAIEARYRWPQQQRIWYSAMLACGRIDDARFLAQPYQLYLEADHLLWSGAREDLAGHRDEAVSRYRGYLATEPWQRSTVPMTMRELFCEWRIAALAARP
jgi:serine/threonine protein kinase